MDLQLHLNSSASRSVVQHCVFVMLISKQVDKSLDVLFDLLFLHSFVCQRILDFLFDLISIALGGQKGKERDKVKRQQRCPFVLVLVFVVKSNLGNNLSELCRYGAYSSALGH